MDGGARIDGRRVKELRRALLLSQRELAQLAGVVTETVNRIERQPDRTFRPDTVRRLAGVLGVDPHELMVVEEPEGVDPTSWWWRSRKMRQRTWPSSPPLGGRMATPTLAGKKASPPRETKERYIVSLTGLESWSDGESRANSPRTRRTSWRSCRCAVRCYSARCSSGGCSCFLGSGMPRGVHQEMALSALDVFVGVVALSMSLVAVSVRRLVVPSLCSGSPRPPP